LIPAHLKYQPPSMMNPLEVRPSLAVRRLTLAVPKLPRLTLTVTVALAQCILLMIMTRTSPSLVVIMGYTLTMLVLVWTCAQASNSGPGLIDRDQGHALPMLVWVWTRAQASNASSGILHPRTGNSQACQHPCTSPSLGAHAPHLFLLHKLDLPALHRLLEHPEGCRQGHGGRGTEQGMEGGLEWQGIQHNAAQQVPRQQRTDSSAWTAEH